MTSFMLIWILLQKIEKLEEELNTYKNNNVDKNWFSVQSSSSPALFLGVKKDMCLHSHISVAYMTSFII